MVPIAGKTARTTQLRSLNEPQPIEVRTDGHGVPRAVLLRRQARPIRKIRDRWRVDDTWWREPLCRMYYELELDDGLILTIFQDCIRDCWYAQRYA